MTCTEPRMMTMLGDYDDGCLNGADRASVDAHLAECASCRKMLSIIGLLSERDAREQSEIDPDHLRPDLLVRFYQAADTLSPKQQTQIRSHLAECQRCAHEYQFLVDLESELHRAADNEP